MSSPIKIAIVTSICVPYDAISSAVLQTYRDFEQSAGFEVHLFAKHNSVPGLPAVLVGDCCGLLLHKDFLEADVIIYHFGIYYDLFDTLPIGNGKAKRIVVFHNITPKELVRECHHPIIDRSFTQLHNIGMADSIWADSDVNRKVLPRFRDRREQGRDRPSGSVVPGPRDAGRQVSLGPASRPLCRAHRSIEGRA